MNIVSALAKPEYIFHPSQIFRRIRCQFSRPRDEYETVRLPWGAPIRICPGESMGSCIRRVGIHDLVSTETIWRLLDTGENAVDVGANIGHMTSAMAFRAGPRGTVAAVEPHPDLFEELSYNVNVWAQMTDSAPIFAHKLAISSHTGSARLNEPAEFRGNRGLSFLVSSSVVATSTMPFHDVKTITLDKLHRPGQSSIALLKIDCEGHELQVLEGAEGLLSRAAIRDILFEEHNIPPTPVTNLLEAHGYRVFHLDGHLLGPVAAPITEPYVRKVRDAPNYLATLEPRRAIARIASKGWGVYSVGPFLTETGESR